MFNIPVSPETTPTYIETATTQEAEKLQPRRERAAAELADVLGLFIPDATEVEAISRTPETSSVGESSPSDYLRGIGQRITRLRELESAA